MGLFCKLLLAAILRGLLAKLLGFRLEDALHERVPALSHDACAMICVIAAVVAIEAIFIILHVVVPRAWRAVRAWVGKWFVK